MAKKRSGRVYGQGEGTSGGLSASASVDTTEKLASLFSVLGTNAQKSLAALTELAAKEKQELEDTKAMLRQLELNTRATKEADLALETMQEALKKRRELELDNVKALEQGVQTMRKTEESRSEAAQKNIESMRKELQASNEWSTGIRTAGGILTSVLRGDVAGTLQGIAGLFQQAAGRKISGAVEAESKTREGAGKAISAAAEKASKARGALGKGVGGTTLGAASGGSGEAGASGAGEAAAGATEGIGAVAALAGPIAAVATAATAATGAMIGLAKAASPVATLRFQLALDDLQATMGKVFLPVLELATQGIRTIADVLATVLPSAEEMEDVLSPVKDVFDEMRDVFDMLAPTIKQLIPPVIQMVKVFTLLNPLILPIVGSFYLLSEGLKLLGLTTGNLKSSVGTAVQQASFTSVKAYASQQYAAAFSAGKVEKKETDFPSLLGGISSILEGISDYVEQIVRLIPGGNATADLVKALIEGRNLDRKIKEAEEARKRGIDGHG